MACIDLSPQAFNMLYNLVYAVSILVADRDLMGSAKMTEESLSYSTKMYFIPLLEITEKRPF